MAICAISVSVVFVSARWLLTARFRELKNLPGKFMYYDLLPKIKNASLARKESFLTPFSKMDLEVGKVLVATGYLKSIEKRTIGKKNYLEVTLVFKDKKSTLSDFKLISKPSRRLYSGYRDVRSVKQGYGLAVLSTPKGVMTERDARKAKVGGEYLFQVW